MKTQVLSILAFLTICIGVYAQQPVGTVFTVADFKYEVTVAGTGSPTSVNEVAIIDYLNVNILTPTIPPIVIYSGATYNVTSLGDSSFRSNSLTSVSIPASVTSIGEDAFLFNSLTSISIPAAVTTLGINAFAYNPNLLTVVSESTNPATFLRGVFNNNSLINLTVPAGLEQTYIDANWFGFKTLNGIDYTLTQNGIVYQILDITNNDEVATFDYTGTSATISIPATVANSGFNYDVIIISDLSFYGNSLTSITIPTSVTTIGASAFNNNLLTSVTIPASITTIGAGAFQNNYNLVTVISESITPATLLSYTFFNNNMDIDLTIPANTANAYNTAGWVGFNSVTEAAACNIVVNIPDANFKTYLVGNTLINTDGDSEISCAEATAFTGAINCASLSISNLTGIEAFVNISGLDVSYNTLTSLDVSANTALTFLSCSTNSLTSLSVSTNIALEWLIIRDNSLTNIDLSTNTNLQNLYCQGNLLTNLDLSTNTALVFLYANDNAITSLDVSSNTTLSRLYSNNNSLTSLNVANGNNSNFSYFDATGNPNLTCIKVDDVTWSNANWSDIDATASFSNNCTPTIYVNYAATGANDGTSWADAYTDLQDALVPDTFSNVWIAKGTYKPTATADRDASFKLYYNLFGGFDGTEANLSDRDLSLLHTTNETILEGDLSGNDNAAQVIFSDPLKSDNSYHVVEVILDNLEINGVTIQNGNADALSGDNRFGGGVFKSLNAPNLSVKNCVIKNNIALSGAGLSLSSQTANSTIVVDACIIDSNLANVGAGLDLHMSQTNFELSISITNSLFKNNKTEDDIVKNRNGDGAAAARLRAYFSNVTLNANIVNNTFVNNSSLGNTARATGNFPVIDISKISGDIGNITVANNIFWGNVRVNSQTAPAIGKSSNTAAAFDTVSSTRIISNNTDEGNLSTFLSTPANTSSVNPNLDANFQLTSGSSAIDSGDNSFITIALDLAGNPRIYNSIMDRGAYEFGSLTLGVNNFSFLEKKITLYPNPTTSVLNIKMTSHLKQATIYSVLGRKVLETTSKTIETSNLKTGLYLIKIEDENGNVSTKRFMRK
ncbi:leucine-rich repeat protein [Lacinutrix undariae]